MRVMLTYEALASKTEKIAVVGLGYVGLPLAVHLSRYFDVVGYDGYNFWVYGGTGRFYDKNDKNSNNYEWNSFAFTGM